jgi:hypothetical protein
VQGCAETLDTAVRYASGPDGLYVNPRDPGRSLATSPRARCTLTPCRADIAHSSDF